MENMMPGVAIGLGMVLGAVGFLVFIVHVRARRKDGYFAAQAWAKEVVEDRVLDSDEIRDLETVLKVIYAQDPSSPICRMVVFRDGTRVAYDKNNLIAGILGPEAASKVEALAPRLKVRGEKR